MNRTDLAKEYAKCAQISVESAETLIALFLDLIQEVLSSGEPVMIRNFGRFEVREREATIRRNPKTGEDIKVPKKRTVLFRPAPALKGCANADRTAD